MPPDNSSRPSPRDFHVAIICALAKEASAVFALFDRNWEDHSPPYPKVLGDPNQYSYGVLGSLNVVLVHMPGMGKRNAAIATTHCQRSFPGIRLALVVGICGCVPTTPRGEEIVLGDVIVSSGVVQHDLGRRTDEGFETKDTLLDALGRPNLELSGMLSKLEASDGRSKLQQKLVDYLLELQANQDLGAQYPGVVHDKLYHSTYRHLEAEKLCDECGCDGELIRRLRLQGPAPQPTVHVGLVASGDTVLRSSAVRDTLAREKNVIAIEMEGAGAWDIFPCLVVKSACDYADSHKAKAWQLYAAATAAACAKAILQFWGPTRAEQAPGPTRAITLPAWRNKNFTGRASETDELKQKLFVDHDCQRLAIVGLGGVGKTQLALQFAHWVKDNSSEHSVFWVSASSLASFEQGYSEIAQQAGILPMTHPDSGPSSTVGSFSYNINELVRQYLNSEASGKWILFIDNVEDSDLFFGSGSEPIALNDHLPVREAALTVVLTRSMSIGVGVAASDVLELNELNVREAKDLLRKSLVNETILDDTESMSALLHELTYLPLAIVQAAAHLNESRMSIKRYLEVFKSTEQELEAMMCHEFRGSTLDTGPQASVASTWLSSFDQIQKSNPQAAKLLDVMSFFKPKAVIPRLLLSPSGSISEVKAIDTLRGYGFLVAWEDDILYDIHSLVHLATRIRTRRNKHMDKLKESAAAHFRQVFHMDEKMDSSSLEYCLPHAVHLLDLLHGSAVSDASSIGHAAARLLTAQGRYHEALPWYERALTFSELCHRIPNARHLLLTLDLAWAYGRQLRTRDLVNLLEAPYTTATMTPGHKKRLGQLAKVLVNTSSGQRDYGRRFYELLEFWVASLLETSTVDEMLRLQIESVMANSQVQNGHRARAIETLERVRKQQAGMLKRTHPDLRYTEDALLCAYEAADRAKDVISMLEARVAEEQNTLPEKDSRLTTTKLRLAKWYSAEKRYQDVINILSPANGAWKKEDAEIDRRYLESQRWLTFAYNKIGRKKEAIQVAEHTLAEIKARTNETDERWLRAETDLAMLYAQNKQHGVTIQLMKHVVAVRQRTRGEEDAERLKAEHELACAYGHFHILKLGKAISGLEHVVKVRRRILEDTNLTRLLSERDLAMSYIQGGMTIQGVDLWKYLVQVYRRAFDEKDPVRASSERYLATLYIDLHRNVEAIEPLQHLAKLYRNTLQDRDPTRLSTERELATLCIKHARFLEATEPLEQLVEVYERSHLETDSVRLVAERDLASVYIQSRRYPDAIKVLKGLVEAGQRSLGEEHPDRLWAEHSLGWLYGKSGKLHQGAELLKHVVKVRKRVLKETDPDRIMTEEHWAVLSHKIAEFLGSNPGTASSR